MTPNKDFYITEADKAWVDKSFGWLIRSYGYPTSDFIPKLFTEQYFPNTISHKQTAVEPLLQDLCHLFNIDPDKISYEIEEDIRDTHGTPYEFRDIPFESEIEIIEKEQGHYYKIYFANALLKMPKRLVFNGIFSFIQIRLALKDAAWITSGDHYFIFYLIGIYTGWGVILAQTMIDTGKENYGGWETKWNYVSPMPVPVMAYSMGLHSSLIGQHSPVWKNYLPSEMKMQYEKAEIYIADQPNPLFNKQALSARDLFKQAQEHSSKKDHDSAIETYQKASFLVENKKLLAVIHNNIGYAHLHKNEYLKSIPHFQKAIELDPGFAYANDNIGFAFIMSGDPETGKHYLSIALQSEKNEPSFTYRNMALYHQQKGETEKARQNFLKAFEHIGKIPVDWLEFFYAKFLYELGETDEAMMYLQVAVEKEEVQAIAWMNEIKK